jgi:hypothetical protein
MIQGFILGVIAMYIASWIFLKVCKKRGLPLLRSSISRCLRRFADDLVNEPDVEIEECAAMIPYRRVRKADGLVRRYTNLILEELDRNG